MPDPLARLEEKLMAAYKNERHLTDAANGVYMTALRNKVDLYSHSPSSSIASAPESVSDTL